MIDEMKPEPEPEPEPEPAPARRSRANLPFLPDAAPDPSAIQADNTRAFLSGEDISSRPLHGLSPLAQRHGRRIVDLEFEGNNPDQIAQIINEGLGRNDHLNAASVRRILTECRKAGMR